MHMSCGQTLRDHIEPAWNQELYGGVPLFTHGSGGLTGRAAKTWRDGAPRLKVQLKKDFQRCEESDAYG
jgi:hypothetical protein